MPMIIFLIFLFGLAIGSFLNCLIYRLPRNEGIFWGRSRCPSCRHDLGWKDLAPVFSYLIQRGKCRYCKSNISIQYPLIELTVAILFILSFVWLNFDVIAPTSAFGEVGVPTPLGVGINLILVWFSLSILLVIFVIDLKHKIIPLKLVISAIIITFLLNVIVNLNLGASPWYNLIIAALTASGFFLAQYLISKGKWIGAGDIYLGVLMGAILGWPNILVALFLAYFLGALAGLILIVLKKVKLSSQIPFGPFLVLGAVLTLFFGNQILNWYLALI